MLDSKSVTVGVEVEIGLLEVKNGHVAFTSDRSMSPSKKMSTENREPTKTSWGYQADCCGEFRSPWYSNSGSFAREWQDFWTEWSKVNPTKLPYFIGWHNQVGIVGHHHHIGLSRGYLTDTHKETIIDFLDKFSPFLSALSANSPNMDVKSQRMMDILRGYSDVDRGRPYRSHLMPYNRNGANDTLEVRMWDANYPQVNLTLFEVEKLIASKVVRGREDSIVIPRHIRGMNKDALWKELLVGSRHGFSYFGIEAEPWIEALEASGLYTDKEPVRSIFKLAEEGMSLRDFLISRGIETEQQEAKVIKPLTLNPTKSPQSILSDL